MFKHPEHIAVWNDAALGREVDWDNLLDGYAAIVDWPGAAHYKTLMEHYPNAIVLLSVRDPERWHQRCFKNSLSSICYVSVENWS